MELVGIVITTIFAAIQYVSCRKGMVQELFQNKKILCLNISKIVYTVASEMQCVHRCLKHKHCGVLNFKESHFPSKLTDNCEVYNLLSTNSTCSTIADQTDWKAMIFKVELPKGGGLHSQCTGMNKRSIYVQISYRVYKSCKEILATNAFAKDGVYQLEHGPHHCIMGDITGCGGDGWTLAMKIDGAKLTFKATAAYWTNKDTYNVENGLKSFAVEEAKFPAFTHLSFDSLCVGMKFSGATNWLRIGLKRDSLLDIFQAGNHISTNLGKSAWKSLMANPSLQLNCNREGFNVKNNGGIMLTRIGFIANQENECISPDSFIGLGSIGTNLPCNAALSAISCGNFASCSPDNGDKSNAAFGYVLVQ